MSWLQGVVDWIRMSVAATPVEPVPQEYWTGYWAAFKQLRSGRPIADVVASSVGPDWRDEGLRDACRNWRAIKGDNHA